MKNLLILAILLVASSCFTLYEPSMISHEITPTTANEEKVSVQVSRHYLLGFGGSKQDGMMAEALDRLNERYVGFLPYDLINISADERKLVVFLIYSKHTLTLNAQLDFKYNGPLNESSKTLNAINRYGFAKGDCVVAEELVSLYSDEEKGYYRITEPLIVKGLSLQNGYMDVLLKDETKGAKTFRAFYTDLRLIKPNSFEAKEGDQVYFYPTGYSGEPLTGKMKRFVSNQSIVIVLNEKSQKAWLALGGELSPQSSLTVPIHRVYSVPLPEGFWAE